MSKRIAIIRDIVSCLPVLKLDCEESVENALRLMDWSQRSAVGITNNGLFSGIFTRENLIHNVIRRGLNPRQTLLADVMTIDPVAVGPECSLLEAFLIFCCYNITNLPVSSARNLLGIVSNDDLRRQISIELCEQKRRGYALLLPSGGCSV